MISSMDEKTAEVAGGIWLTQVCLLCLKLSEAVDWSWWWIWSPSLFIGSLFLTFLIEFELRYWRSSIVMRLIRAFKEGK